MRRFVLIASLFVCALVSAHEGHRPLPTRGMEIDVKTGKMILTAASRTILDVQTAEVASQSLSPKINTYGSIVAPWNQHAVIASPLPGRITELLVIPGQTVTAGQVVAILESVELDQLVLELRAAQVEWSLAEKLVSSLTQATQAGAVAGARIRESRAKLEQARAAVALASAKWQALKLPAEALSQILASPESNLRQRLELRSPISGIITHADLSLGKVVTSKEHLFEVLDLDIVWLKIQVLEKDLARLTTGQSTEFQLTTNTDVVFPGEIDVIGYNLDPQTHWGTVWATLRNDHASGFRLLPGMTGKVQIDLSSADEHLVVPFSAVMRDGAERFVLVEQEQTAAASIYQKQPLIFGQRQGDQIAVMGGNLFPGDRVVTRGIHELGGYFAKGVLEVGPETARDIGLQTETLSAQAVQETVSIDGIVDVPPTHRSVASAQLGGVIERILVDRGDTVQTGQILAEITSESFTNMQLELLRTHLEAEWTRSVVDYLKSANEAIPARQLWEEESKLNQLLSRRDILRQQLFTAGVSEPQMANLLSHRELILTLPVKAAIGGVIVGFDKFLGHVVVPDEPLFEIHDLGHAWIQGFVSEYDFTRIQVGQTGRIRFVAAPDEVVVGRVARSGQAISAADRTLSIWLDLSSMPTFALRQGMMARITIETGESHLGLSLPNQAIVREGLRCYVFVQTAAQTFERRFVELGWQDDLRTVVLTGLAPGEVVAIAGVKQLQSGYAALK